MYYALNSPFGDINCVFFFSEDKSIRDRMYDYLLKLPKDSSIIKSIFRNRFEMNKSEIEIIGNDYISFCNFLCLEGLDNVNGTTRQKEIEYHNKYWNIIEIQNIRQTFGNNIV